MKQAFQDLVEMCTTQGLGPTAAYILSVLIIFFIVVIAVAVYLILFWLLKKLTHVIFRRLEKRRGHRIHIEFLERITNLAVALVVIISFLGWKDVGRSLLGSAAVLTGVIGFAAQDVIKDILSGLLISIYKPFDLGDRIELEDGTAGIVESITMRHIVIVRIDTLRVVIPNSKINAASILNYSYGEIQRSCLFKFPVGYESDIKKTKTVIYDAVKESPYSIPGKRRKDGAMGYGDIYFIELADSALIMAVTVYYESNVAGERLKDDINTRVFTALEGNGIEIPYNYTSVVIRQEGRE